MRFELSRRSIGRLSGVHPDLQKVALAGIRITPVDFAITCGVRTLAQQESLFRAKMTRTMNSRHLKQPDGYAHAFDVAAYVNGAVSWHFPLYEEIAGSMKEAAKMVGVPIEWGGDWETFRDGPHFQLPKGYGEL